MLSPNQTVVLRVQLDEGKTEDQLKQLVLDIEKTRAAQVALSAERRKGIVTDEQFAQQTVALRTQLKGQTGEQAALTKNLTLFRTATGELANSYTGQQAQLSLAQRQYQQLAGSQTNSTESTKALAATIADLRKELVSTDAEQQLFVRNVGNYPKGENLESLVRQLVALQEQTKGLAAGTDEAARAQMRIVGFQTQAAQAGAKEGKSYEETTNFIREYGEAIRPATADLVKLSEQQQRAADSGEALGEEAQQIGFKIGEAQASIKKTTDALKDIPAQAAPAQQGLAGLGDKASVGLEKLGEAATKLPGPLAGVAGGLVETGKGLLTATKAALAFIATPLGLVLAAIAAAFYVVKEALTATDEGQEDLAAGSAALGAVLNVLKGVVIEAGKFIIKLFTDPKAAAQDLLDFVEGQVINRVKAYGVIFDGLRNGDFGKATDGVLQLATGVENVTGKTQALTGEFRRAAAAAAGISREKDKLEDLEIAAVARNEQQRQQAERLVATAKDRNLTEKQRLANLDEASRLEKNVLSENLKIEGARLAIIQQENAEAARRGVLQDDQRRAEAEQQAKLAQQQGEFEKAEQQRENRRSILQQQESNVAKQTADKALALATKLEDQRIKLRKETLALENQLLDRQLLTVQANSNEELSILQQKLRNSYQSELAQKDLTVRQKLLLDRKYEDDSLKLAQDTNKARALAAYDAELATVNTELLAVKKGADAETDLRREAIDTQLQKELAALDKRKDNAAQENLLRANAAKAVNDVNYNAALNKLDKFLTDQRSKIEEANARGLLSEKEYNRAVTTADSIAAGTRLQLAKDFKQDTVALEGAAKNAQIAIIKELTSEEKAEIDKRIAAGRQFGEQVGSLIAESLFEQGATIQEFLGKILILALDVVEKQLIAQQVATIGSASIQALGQPDSVATFGATGFARIAILSAAITAAFEIAKAGISAFTTPPKVFAWGGLAQVNGGGIAHGPSHEQGGIPLYHRGQSAGIEIQGGEPVLIHKVAQNPLLLSIASFVNQAAGGRALVASSFRPHLALGGVASPLVQQQLTGNVQPPIDYNRLAFAFEKINIITKTQDTVNSLKRHAETQALSNN